MLYRFGGKQPMVAEGTYVSEIARVIGDVVIGSNCYIGHGAILRGDYGRIEIGDGTAVEEGVIVHAPPGETNRIGRRVTIGHGAVVHGRFIDGMPGRPCVHAFLGSTNSARSAAAMVSPQLTARMAAVGLPPVHSASVTPIGQIAVAQDTLVASDMLTHGSFRRPAARGGSRQPESVQRILRRPMPRHMT